MNNKIIFRVLLGLGVFPVVGSAQFVDTFDTLNPAWTPNRYAPAGFAPAVFDGGNRLQLTISGADSAANRPATFSSEFYDIQGEQRPGGITGLWTLSAQVYVASAFASTTGPLVHGSLWAHTGTTPGGGDYMILGFINASPTDGLNPAAADRAFHFQASDSVGSSVDLGVPAGFVFDAWHLLSGTSTGTTFEYRIDGVLVYTRATASGSDLMSAMIQGYNFGEAGSYSVYWDNVTTSAIPEPAVVSFIAGLAALGLAGLRRRRAASKSVVP